MMRRTAYISFVAWGAVAVMLVIIWRWLNAVEIPPAVVNKVNVPEIYFCFDVVAIVLTGVLYALVLAVLVKTGRAFRMRRVAYISFATGWGVAIALFVFSRTFWYLVEAGRIPDWASLSEGMSDISLFICPPGILLMEIDPLAPLNIGRATFFATVMLLNGALYAFVVVVLVKVARTFRQQS